MSFIVIEGNATNDAFCGASNSVRIGVAAHWCTIRVSPTIGCGAR